MGEPAIPTPQERVERRRIARGVIDAVREDRDVHLPRDHSQVKILVFGLAQEVEMLFEENLELQGALTNAWRPADR